MSTYSQLKDSTEQLGDVARLAENLHEDGYILLRGLLPPARALQVKSDILAVLQTHDVIENDVGEEPSWSGGPHPTEAEHMRFYDEIVRLDSYNQLAESPEIVSLMEALLEGPVRVWKQRLIRIIYPDPDSPPDVGLGAHQDGNVKFGYMADRFFTGWLPIMDIDATMGGLAVAPGSHKLGFLEHSGAAAPSSARDAKARGFGLDASELKWATSDYHPGDALFFTQLTAHHGLINRSDRIRLSCDFRYQAAEASANWLAHTPGPDVRRVAQQVDEIIASRALYVTTHADPETLDEVRRLMLEEKSVSLERAQQLVEEVRAQ